nr:MAG TPA: hypothetical protein [Caudoviricetes sp.]
MFAPLRSALITFSTVSQRLFFLLSDIYNRIK